MVEDFSLCLGYGNQELSIKNIKKKNQISMFKFTQLSLKATLG